MQNPVCSLHTTLPERGCEALATAASEKLSFHLKQPEVDIHLEAGRGNTERVLSHLEAGVSIEIRDRDHRTPLHFAAIAGKRSLLIALLARGADANASDRQSKTPLHWAVAAGDITAVQLLLDAGADSEKPFYSGESALHLAAFLEHTDTVRLLLSRGTSVHVTDCEGRTPLHTAALVGDPQVIRVLLDAGAKASQPDRLGRVALHCASAQGHVKAVQELLSSCATTDYFDKTGVTPLYLAAFKGYTECMAALLEGRKANMEAIDLLRGTTALHAASAMGQTAAVRLLLSRGANWQAVTKHGQRALDLAQEAGHEEIVQLLQLAPPPPKAGLNSPTNKRLQPSFSSLQDPSLAQRALPESNDQDSISSPTKRQK